MKMQYQSLIEKLVQKDVLMESLVALKEAASDGDIASAEERLGQSIDSEYKKLLQVWNGADLDVVRLFSTDELDRIGLGLRFAHDPTGFVFYLNERGEVDCEDTDGGRVKTVATSFEDFFFNYLFGSRSDQYMGKEWMQELADAGIPI